MERMYDMKKYVWVPGEPIMTYEDYLEYKANN